MLVDDILVITDGRPGLGFSCRHRMYFAGSLVNKREQHFRRNPLFLQQFGGKRIQVIGEVAGKDGS